MTLVHLQFPVVQAGIDDEETKRLEAELETVVQSRNALVEEFQKLASIIRQTQLSGISLLPNELLIDIFTDVVRADPANRLRLQLVSRRWHEIFLQTPILWSTFRITIPTNIRDIEESSSYWERCIKRSAECPLDISLYYSKPLSPIVSMSDYLIKTLPSWISEKKMAEFLLGYDGSPSSILLHLHNIYLRPIILFTAHPGSMERWKSFELRSRFGAKNCFEMALSRNLFGRRTPLLEKLTLWVVDDGRPVFSLYDCIFTSRRCQIPFPHTPALKELYLHDIKVSFSTQSPEQIEQLDTICGDIEVFKETMVYRNVKYLRIGISTNTAGDINQFERAAIFPHLRRLHLIQQVPPWFYRMLEAPLLEVIVFEDFFPTHTFRVYSVLPSLKRVEFRWTYMHNGAAGILDTMLPILLRQSPVLETLLVSHTFEESITRRVRSLLASGIGSGSLKSLLLVKEPTSKDVIDVVHF